jgi:NADPH:quinone reductase-like Zn-dependent oxidoreductase
MPSILPDDVLVRVVAASVNPVDWKIRRGYLQQMISYRLPLVLGWDLSGVVAEVGANVTQFAVGDSVFSRPDIRRDGTYAEYVAVRATELALKPSTISHVESATLPLAGITAWESLVTNAELKSGQRVLIHAASGGVGSLAVQIAKFFGAHVTATTSAANLDLVSSLGADTVIDYRAQSFEKIVEGMDVVFDTVGGKVQDASWSVMRPGGILVSITDPPPKEKAESLGLRSAFVFIQPNAAVLRELGKLVDGGRVRPIVGAELGLCDVVKAHDLSESGHAKGKIALYVGQP